MALKGSKKGAALARRRSTVRRPTSPSFRSWIGPEACSAFTRVTACTLALSPIRDTLTEGFSHFVTSMTAPVASGWSGCRVGLAPTGKRRLSRRTPKADLRLRSDRLGDDHAVWAAERPPLGLAPTGIAQPRRGVVLAIGLTFTRYDQELARHQGGGWRLRVA